MWNKTFVILCQHDGPIHLKNLLYSGGFMGGWGVESYWEELSTFSCYFSIEAIVMRQNSA
jgi:hypothetical protein